MSNDLDFYRLKGLEYGQLTGVNIGVHALDDAFMLMHCGVGCKHKTTSQLSSHDLARNVVEREGWTEVGDAELITGASGRIGPYLRSWYARVQPSLIVVISVTFLDLTGEDLPFVVKEEGETIPCPVLRVSAPGTGGDLFLGYQNMVIAVLRTLDWKKKAQNAKGVAILGYYFDRYEGDHIGNLQQLGALLKILGLELQGVAFSGVSIDKLQAIPEQKYQLVFPLLQPKIKRIQRFTKRNLIEIHLPIGVRLTSEWLQIIGKEHGVPERLLQQVLHKKEEQTREKLQIAQRRCFGLKIGIVADLPHAIGLYSLLQELGFQVVFVGLRGDSFGGSAEFKEALERHKLPIEMELDILEHPSLQALITLVDELGQLDELDGLIASATEINAIENNLCWEGKKPFLLEFGFPCRDYHVTRPTPYMGYVGCLAFADRILSVLSRRY